MLKKNLKEFFIDRIRKKLTIGFSKRAGRNFFGRKTIFTQGGGVFVKIRVIDFKRTLHCNGILLSIEKDINRTGFVGLICYENGLYTYILLPLNYVQIGSYVYGFKNIFAMNYSTFLLNIPTGNFVHHIETIPGKGAKLARAAGCSSFIISNEDLNVVLKMNSGWLLKISKFCIAVVGAVSNNESYFKRLEKAGKNRNLGWKPRVRGVAMNPCDHPHGGGEGTGSPPRAHKTPWGKLTKIPTKRKKKFLLKKKPFKKILMSRSKKKIGYVHRSLFLKNMNNEEKKELRQSCYKLLINPKMVIEPSCLFWKRSSLINENLLNKKIAVYNGWGFNHADITKDLIGFKLCELHTTRRTPRHKGKQRQKKKVVKKTNVDKTLNYIKKKGWA